MSATGLSGTGALSLANGNLTSSATAPLQTFNGTISGNGSLLVSPTMAALLTLGGNNVAFAGGITGNGNARLAITNANALGSGPVNVSAQNASSDFVNPTLGFKLGDGSSTTLANNIVLSQTTGGLNLVFSAMDVPNQTIELAGVISSSGGSTNTLVWGAQGSINSNTLILSNSANSFVANVRVNFGTIAIGSDGALGASSNQVTLANTGPTVEGSLRFDADAISLNRQINVNGNGASINTNGVQRHDLGPLYRDQYVLEDRGWHTDPEQRREHVQRTRERERRHAAGGRQPTGRHRGGGDQRERRHARRERDAGFDWGTTVRQRQWWRHTGWRRPGGQHRHRSRHADGPR